MDALGVAVTLPEIGEHGFQYLFIHPGIGMVFKICFFHNYSRIPILMSLTQKGAIEFSKKSTNSTLLKMGS